MERTQVAGSSSSTWTTKSERRRVAKKKRKVITVRADEVMAGDRIVIKEGSIRKFFPVCEVQQRGQRVLVIYRAPTGFVTLPFWDEDPVRVKDI